MNKNILMYLSIFFVLLVGGIVILKSVNNKDEILINAMNGTVLSVSNTAISIQDSNNIIYTLEVGNTSLNVGDNILIEYTGILDKNTELQDISIINYSTYQVSQDDFDIPTQTNLDENGIFKNYYQLAINKLKTLSLDEKIGQLFLVKYPDNDQVSLLQKYNFAGYVFYEKDFSDKNKTQVVNMMNELQDTAKVPIFTAVDEEGGSVVRVSSNPNLVNSKFLSPSELYKEGGFEVIKQDTINKSKVLYDLGLNLNLAPVVDVATDTNSYIYDRTIGLDTNLTSTYAKTVIEASKSGKVSYTLKHFPGYGNNGDTHTGTSTDTRSYDDIRDNDLPPFKAGIDAGCESVLVSHNIVTSIDDVNPASLSASVHNLLRNDLGFTGVIITDDMAMSAVSSIDDNIVKAILAGNDLIMVTDYANSILEVKNAINDSTLSEEHIDKIVTRILAWKYYKNMIIENQK